MNVWNKRGKLTMPWIKLHDEKLHNLHSSPKIIKVMKSVSELGKVCRTHGRDKNVYKILVRKPKGKASFGRVRRRREETVKQDL
jgi:hypothetical protein